MKVQSTNLIRHHYLLSWKSCVNRNENILHFYQQVWEIIWILPGSPGGPNSPWEYRICIYINIIDFYSKMFNVYLSISPLIPGNPDSPGIPGGPGGQEHFISKFRWSIWHGDTIIFQKHTRIVLNYF